LHPFPTRRSSDLLLVSIINKTSKVRQTEPTSVGIIKNMSVEFDIVSPVEFNMVTPMNAPITAEIVLIIRLVILLLVNQYDNVSPTITPLTIVIIISIKYLL